MYKWMVRGRCLFSLEGRCVFHLGLCSNEPLFSVVLLLALYYDHTQTSKGFLYLEYWVLWVSETCYGFY